MQHVFLQAGHIRQAEEAAQLLGLYVDFNLDLHIFVPD